MLYTQYIISKRTFMKHMILSVILFCIMGSMQYELMAQPKSVKYDYLVPANSGEVVSTFVTNPKSIYTVTVQGTFFLTSGLNGVKADGFAIESVPGTVPPELWPPSIVENKSTGRIDTIATQKEIDNLLAAIRRMDRDLDAERKDLAPIG